MKKEAFTKFEVFMLRKYSDHWPVVFKTMYDLTKVEMLKSYDFEKLMEANNLTRPPNKGWRIPMGMGSIHTMCGELQEFYKHCHRYFK